MLSIILLTHNRPDQFKVCINNILNVLSNYDYDYEILVNNDSKDIMEITHKNIKYTYFNEPVNSLYEIMYRRTIMKYIWFIEDDDIHYTNDLLIKLGTFDLGIGIYKAYLKERNILQFHEQIKNIKNSTFNYEFFQLSQMIFKKIDIIFPKVYHNENDEYLLTYILRNIDITYLSKHYIFRQGYDGTNLSKETICSDI